MRPLGLGLVWERNEIDADIAVDENFVACEVVQDLCEKPAPWRNLVIEGDNFDALRWLRMTMTGRVKCIYIDPPYNTGNIDWVYNDRFVDADDRYRQSTWLEFLYRRLTLARDLLSEDGVILVSINDNQRAKLELLMDEAMPGMRVGTLTWRTRNGSNAGQVGFLSPDHEHILVYSMPGFACCGTERSLKGYSNPDDDPRGDWQSVPIRFGFSRRDRPNLYYPLRDPETDIWYPCNPDSVWRFATQERVKPGTRLQTQPVEDFIAQGRIKFPDQQVVRVFETLEALFRAIDKGEVPASSGVPVLRRDLPDIEFWVGRKIGYGTPCRKLYVSEFTKPTQPLSSWISWASEVGKEIQANQIVAGSNTEATRTVREIFGHRAFNYPKPVSLIRELVRQATGPTDVILDFFAGSGTTAQAVMELNAEDGGDRRFILVSSTEASEDEPEKNICRDITAERIRRLNASEDRKYGDLAAGFAYLRTRAVQIEDMDCDLEPADAWAALEAMHDLPLTLYQDSAAWNAHEGDGLNLVMVNRFTDDLIPWLGQRARQNVHVYAWAPGEIKQALGSIDVEVRSVHDTLVKLFQQ